MDKQGIIKLLKELKSERGIIGKIEWAIGIPKNNLSGYISGSKEIPQKFIKPLSDYLENGEYIRKTIELPRDFIGVEKIGIIRADGTIEEIKNYEDLPESYQIAWQSFKSLTQESFNGLVNKGISVVKFDKEGAKVIDPFSYNPKNAQESQNKPQEAPKKENGGKDAANEEIYRQIAFIRSEKIPKERDTFLGKKIWQKEQEAYIKNLKTRLK